MSWHIEQETINRYSTGTIGRVSAASVEAHLATCVDCRSLLTVDRSWLEQSWASVADIVEAPKLTAVERALSFIGVPKHLARLISVTPSLRPSWVLAVAVSLLFAGLASRLAVQQNGVDLFLMLAPVVPVAGVAVAYGRLADPAYEITVSSPVDPLRLLLLRSAAVTVIATAFSLLVDMGIRSDLRIGLWLLPALALTIITLALGTRLTMWVAASVVTTGWVALVVSVSLEVPGRSTMVLFTPFSQLSYLLALVAGAWVLSRRHDNYRRGDSR
jgi:hypothetical protein